MLRLGERRVVRSRRRGRVSGEVRAAWIALLLGVGIVAVLGTALDLPLDGLLGVLGAAAGYGLYRLLPRPPRRGPPKYWRGRAYWD